MELPDDYCEACHHQVANHETDHGILCCGCYTQIYGICSCASNQEINQVANQEEARSCPLCYADMWDDSNIQFETAEEKIKAMLLLCNRYCVNCGSRDIYVTWIEESSVHTVEVECRECGACMGINKELQQNICRDCWVKRGGLDVMGDLS